MLLNGHRVSFLRSFLCLSTEEQGEDTEGSAKSTSVAVADDKDSSERDNSEGKKSCKDSGKMLEFCLPPFFNL